MARAMCVAALWAARAAAATEADPVLGAVSSVWGLWAETASWLSATAELSKSALFLAVDQPSTTVYDIAFQDEKYKDAFVLDYSHDQHSSSGEKRHFEIETSPDGSGKALRMSIYNGDKSFDGGSTFPRTELSGVRDKAIKDGKAYTVQWDVFISKYEDPYMFCMAQIFGGGPNVMLRWEKGQYQIWSNERKEVLSGSVHDDLNHWVTWRLDFKLSKDGYVKVFRGGQSLGEITGDTAAGTNSYWKQGMYTQHVDEVKDMTMYVRNLRLETA